MWKTLLFVFKSGRESFVKIDKSSCELRDSMERIRERNDALLALVNRMESENGNRPVLGNS